MCVQVCTLLHYGYNGGTNLSQILTHRCFFTVIYALNGVIIVKMSSYIILSHLFLSTMTDLFAVRVTILLRKMNM